MVGEKFELVEQQLKEEQEFKKDLPIKIIHFDTGLILIGKYSKREKKLYDAMQLVMRPIKMNDYSAGQGMKIEFNILPVIFGLSDDDVIDLSNHNCYVVIEPKNEIKEKYKLSYSQYKTGLEFASPNNVQENIMNILKNKEKN
jgi:hypothetical protein